ncbi:MAG: DUF5596 domain-containing protein [Oscillospiraceae bacterium]|nr:DUF5596 domain-containing protein [Oscillospiraceae bacterium]
MTLEAMCNELGISKKPESFGTIYEKIKDTYEPYAALILSDEYITKTLSDCFALASFTQEILASAAEVRKNPALRLLVCIMAEWIRHGAEDIADYEAPHGKGTAFDFLHLFPMIPTMPDTVAHLRERNIPEDIIIATMQEYDFCVDMLLRNTGRPAFDRGRLNWMRRVAKNEMIRIGRFKYDLPAKRVSGIKAYKNVNGEICVLADGVDVHRSGKILGSAGCGDKTGSFRAEIEETQDKVIGYPIVDGLITDKKCELDKAQWSLCLSEDDNVVFVHIPPRESFDVAAMEASYARAREILAKHYPDRPYSAFFCRSWLMSRDLRKVLKPTSNILAFQDKYIHYPCLCNGTQVFNNVFPGIAVSEDYTALPEETSLQRNVKNLYINGGHILNDCGFFF